MAQPILTAGRISTGGFEDTRHASRAEKALTSNSPLSCIREPGKVAQINWPIGMDNYRALKGIRDSAALRQCHLNPEEILQLRGQAAYSPTSAYLLKAGELESLSASCPEIIFDRGRQKRAKHLAYYFSRRAGLVRLRADYHDPGQTERGIRALLASPDIHTKGAVFFIGLEDSLFDQLCNRATAESADVCPSIPADGQVIDHLRILLDQNPRLKVPQSLKEKYVGNSDAADGVRKRILLAAGAKFPVLIEGETGTGKEIVARMIHQFSDRSSENFMPVNCGGIPIELFESELFGHVQGAFTGALRNKTGLWTLADVGTLFLDEIGDLSPLHQVKVLRALEDGRYRPLGGDQEIQSGARIIAATNRNLRQLVEAGKFRDDLFYRLFTLRIQTPSLHEHLADIPELAIHFWNRPNEKTCSPLPAGVLEELMTYGWPGNARELRSFLSTLSAVADGSPVTLQMARVVMRDRLNPSTLPTQDA